VVSQCDPALPNYSEPTTETLKVVKNYIKGREVVTHRELGLQGKATLSSCPGRLLDLLK